MEVHYRKLDIKRKKGNNTQSYPVTLSTETPVLRSFGYEVLDHSPDSVDLSREPLPLIESHDSSKLNIGIVQNLRIESRKLKGQLVLGHSARAKELKEDIDAGIVRNVSLGYSVFDREEVGESDGYPVYKFKFQPYELSLVAAPADVNSGIYRSRGDNMGTETKLDTKQTRSERKRISRETDAERQRASQILQSGREHGFEELALDFINDGRSVSEFNLRMLEEIGKDNEIKRGVNSYSSEPVATQSFNVEQFGSRFEGYSLQRVLHGIADPKMLQYAGFELEVSQELSRSLGKKTKGVLVPFEALQSRAVSYAGDGSNIVGTNLMPGNFIDVLRARSHVMQLGPTVINGLVGNVDIPKKNSSAVGDWIAGDGSDSITESDPSFGKVVLSPKVVGGATTFSHRMLMQSSPDIENLIRQDLADMVSSEIDAKAIAGSGSSNEPTGVINQTGVNVKAIGASGQPTYQEMVGFETEIAIDNADTGSLGYLTTPEIRGHLKSTEVSNNTGIFTWALGSEPGKGVVNGYSAYASSNVPDNGVIFGNWNDLIVGFWGGIEIDVDPYGANFLKGSVTVRVLADIDIAVRHAESFCING